MCSRNARRPRSQTCEQSGTRFVDAPRDKLRFDSTAAPDVGQGGVLADVPRKDGAGASARHFKLCQGLP